MRNKQVRMSSRVARIVTLILVMAVSSISAQDLPLVDARPGPEFGTRPGDGLTMPTDVAVGIEGRVYVVDSGRHRVAHYDATGNPLGYFGSEGKADGELQGPVGIAAGSDGTVYVADRGNQRVQVYAADGIYRRSLALVEEGEAVTPVDVVVTADGKSIFVTANNSHRVLSFTRNGKILGGWGGEGKDFGLFRYPASLTLSGVGNVLVVDVLNQRVQIFNSEGAPQAEFGTIGALPGTFIRPKGIALDNNGQIFVSDSYLGVVQVFDSGGGFVGVLGNGGEPVRFQAPTGLAFAAGRLYVTDMLAGKVFSYDLESAQ